MEINGADKKRVTSTVFWITLLFATLGLATQLAIVLVIGFGSRWEQYTDQLIAAVVGTYLSAVAGGLIVGQFIYRNGTKGASLWLAGILTAWICLFVSTLAGSSVEYLRWISHHNAFGDYIFKPMFWFLFLGTIPAAIFGTAYAASIRYLLKERLV